MGGLPPNLVMHRWERCSRYSVLVNADGATGVWHLDDDVADGAITGTISGSKRFYGTNSLAVGGAPDISGTKPYTLELWARPPDHPAGSRYQFLISRETTTPSGRQGTGVWLSAAGVGFERWTDGVKAGITYAAGIPQAEWSAVTATYDGSTMRLYVDGRLIGSRQTTAGLAPPAGPFVLGAGADGRSGFFEGDLDELALYDHALIRSHVSAHVSRAVTPPCTQITDADAATYTPTFADLGYTLRVLTNSTIGYPESPVTVSSYSESPGPVDAAGQLVRPTILSPAANATVNGTVHLTAAVGGVPPDRIEFLVDGVVRYAKVGEAPYQYAWNTTVARNGPHTVGVRVYGPRSQTPVTAQHTVTVGN